MTRHCLNVTDFTADEVALILAMAERPTSELTVDGELPMLGKGAALIFEKPSNRTRQSMEMAVFQLGGHPIYTRGEEVGFDVREPVEDITYVMEGYHALLAARVFDHAVVERMAAVASVPIINMLSDYSHPLQAFADALTMRQLAGPLAGKTVAYVGDYNNVARSLGEISALLGMHVRYGCPTGFDADAAELERIQLLGAPSVVQVARPSEAVAGADFVHTDTWVSMGQEADKQARQQAFEGYTVDTAMMAAANPDAWFMHCLPAYRGLEVAADVIDGDRSAVYQQAHNRMHAARAIIAFLRGAR